MSTRNSTGCGSHAGVCGRGCGGKCCVSSSGGSGKTNLIVTSTIVNATSLSMRNSCSGRSFRDNSNINRSLLVGVVIAADVVVTAAVVVAAARAVEARTTLVANRS